MIIVISIKENEPTGWFSAPTIQEAAQHAEAIFLPDLAEEIRALKATSYKQWHEARLLTGLSDGDAVSQFDDKSGMGNHLMQADESFKPMYKNLPPGKYPLKESRWLLVE